MPLNENAPNLRKVESEEDMSFDENSRKLRKVELKEEYVL